MRQIFKTHPWVPPKELPETQDLFRKYGVPGSIRPGHLLKGKGEPSKLYLITKGAAAYYVADRYKSHPSVLSLLIPGCSACDLSVITGDRVNVTTRAIGPCEVLIMQPHVLTDLMKNNSEFAAKEAAHVTRKQECSIEAMVANFTLEPAEPGRISGTRLIVKFVLAKSSHNHYFRLFKQTSLQFLDLL